MRSPRLNRQLVLEERVALPDGLGGHGVAWQALGTFWAEMDARMGRAGRAEAVSLAEMRWRITVPGAPDGAPSRPRPGQRLRLGARVFSVLAVAERDPEGRFLICEAREEVPA